MAKKLNIAYALDRSGLAQQDLWVALGISAASVCNWVAGKSCPKASRLPEIARILGCTVDELYTDSLPQRGGKDHGET